MATEQEIHTAKHGILNLLAMRMEHKKHFNGIADLGKTNLKNQLSGLKISVPDHDTVRGVKKDDNHFRATPEAIGIAIDALLADHFIIPEEARGGSSYIITDAGRKELKAMDTALQAAGVTAQKPAVRTTTLTAAR